jgi:hypothetical protein
MRNYRGIVVYVQRQLADYRKRPHQVATDRASLLGRVSDLVVVLDDKFDRDAFYEAHVARRGADTCPAAEQFSLAWAREVIDDALSRLPKLADEMPSALAKAGRDLEVAHTSAADAASEFVRALGISGRLKNVPAEIKIPGYHVADLVDAVYDWKDAGQALHDAHVAHAQGQSS